MKCKQCKFDNDCEARNKAQWIYGEGRAVIGCTLGEPAKESYCLTFIERVGHLFGRHIFVKGKCFICKIGG